MDETNSASRELARLDSGYLLHYRERVRAIELLAPDGRICVQITLTPEGPRIELHAVSLAVRAEHALAIDCERLDIYATRGLVLRTGGDLELAAEGELRSEALAQHHQATLGDIEMKANDDVMLLGERIRLNSPRTPSDELERTRPTEGT